MWLACGRLYRRRQATGATMSLAGPVLIKFYLMSVKHGHGSPAAGSRDSYSLLSQSLASIAIVEEDRGQAPAAE